MSLLARCSRCVKTYRVPHDRKEWHCKVCQGVLEVETEAAEPTLLEGETCPACGAIAFEAQAFCEECGHALGPAAGEAPRRANRQEELQAGAEMRRAFKKLSRLKTYLTYNLWMSYLGGFAVLMFVLRWELPPGMKVLLVLIQSVSIGLAFAAVRMVDRRPFTLVTTLAGLQTLAAIWSYYDGTPNVLSAIWAVVLWLLAVDAAQVTRLAKQYPDLYLSRRLRGEHLSRRGKVVGRSSKRASEGNRGQALDDLEQHRVEAGKARRAEASRDRAIRRRRKRLLLGGAAAFVVALFAFFMWQRGESSPARAATIEASLPSPEGAIERFRLAWNAGDIPAMVAEAKPSLAPKLERSLTALGERYEWGTQFPPLGEAEWEEPTAANLRVFYSTEVGAFPVRFIVEDGRWVLRTITTRRTSPTTRWRARSWSDEPLRTISA